MTGPEKPMSHRLFVERLVITLLVVGVALLFWQLRGLLILVFGAILLSVILTVVARPFVRWLRIPDWAALLIAVALLLALFGTAFWMFGWQIVQQADSLQEKIPAAWSALEKRLHAWGIGDSVRQWTQQIRSGGGVMANMGGIATSVGSAIADTLLVIVGGIYLAARPGLYRSGVIKLIPEKGRPLAAQALDDSGRALRLWLLGRLVSMVGVGLLTGLGLWLIGVPAALTLGLLAGLLEFVPFIGPIAASIPAILLALAQSPETALWTALLFLIIQQIEGNILEPLVQQRAVDLPPALLLFALVAGGLVFGIVGIIFAAPLTVVIYVLVKRLYVREALDTPTPIPGEENSD
ncbi:MAG TPA: AI-2E family transporter [Allosphingosinicella sp.]|nr:AI-2E family transporter [Allosphingosinicella sp.]